MCYSKVKPKKRVTYKQYIVLRGDRQKEFKQKEKKKNGKKEKTKEVAIIQCIKFCHTICSRPLTFSCFSQRLLFFKGLIMKD